MAEIEKLPVPAFQNGTIREAALDEVLSPNDTVELALNLNFDRIGALQTRNGLTILGEQIQESQPVLGIGNFRNNAGSTYRALAKVNQNVHAYNGSSWSSVRSGLAASSKARFTNFVGYTYMVNGNANQAVSTYNGSGSFGSTNIGSLAAADFIENYRTRIWTGNQSNDKLFYTDVASTSGVISGGTSFIQISPQDGERITGLKRYPRALLVFKNNHIYRIFSTTSTDPDPSIFRGTYSHESIVEGKNGISYHHPSGFYNFVFDGDQIEISRPIADIVSAIPRTYYENISGWSDDNNKYWSIGDITLGGVSFSNIVCRYTISTQVWTVYSYGSEIRSAGLYDDGTTLRTIVGNDNGKVLTFDSGNTDDGTPIFYDLITHPMYFTNLRSSSKTLSEIATLHQNGQGGNLSYQIDSDKGSVWRPIGQLTKDLYQVDKLNAKFTKIRFRLSGSSSGSPFIFRGWELLNMMTDGELRKPQ
jgi:hypothetical protein